MPRLNVIVASLALATVLAGAAPVAGRPRVALAGEWRWQWLTAADATVGDTWEKRPAKLPGTVRFPEAGKAAAVFERTVEIPADWAGRRVVLHVGHPVFGLAVTVNGQAVGELPAYGGEVDVTAAARPGAANTLQLRAFHFGDGLQTMDAYTRATIPALGWEKSLGGILGEDDTFYFENQPATAVVTDVWYRAFCRGQQRLEPQVTVRCARPIAAPRLEVTVREADTNDVALTHTLALPPLPAGESVQTVMLPAKTLKLWWPGTPYLYRGQIRLLDGDGTELDRSEPTLFGLREIWMQGKQFYVNGHPIHFTLDAYYFSDREKSLEENLREALAAGVTLTYGKHASIGTAIVHDNGDWAAVTDRLGMGLVTYGVSVGYAGGDLTDPAVFAAYRRWTAAHLRRFRNHPSILFWCLSTNFAGGSNSPTVVGRAEYMRDQHAAATLSYMVHKELDPTRPAFHHAGQGVGDFDTSNTYFNHLPRQEVEDWLSAYAESADRPYMVVEFNGVPLAVDYIKHYSDHPLVSYVTEYGARLAGDAAYAAETADYRQYANYAVPRLKSHWQYAPFAHSDLVTGQVCENMGWVTRACRFRKVPTDLWVWPPDPRTYPDPDDPHRQRVQRLGDTAVALQAPLQFWLGGPADDWTAKDHDFYSGETVAKSLLVMDDRRVWPYTRFGVVWEVKDAASGEVVAAGDTRPDGEIMAPWYARLAIPITFTAPPADRPRDLRLTARLVDARGDHVFGEDALDLTVYPRPAPTVAPKVTVFDPVGDTTAWLAAQGVSVIPFEPGTPPAGNLLIVGRDALSGDVPLPFTPAEVAAGLRVVVFEQRAAGLERFGFRYEAQNPRHAYVRQPDHPLAAGLDTANLHDWRGASTLVSWGPERDGAANSRRAHHWSNRGTVASTMLETPHCGPFRTILDTEFDLAYTPLLHWRHGTGEVVFCQLDVTARTQTEPAAEIVKHNLLRYLAMPPVAPPATRIAVSADADLRALVAALGYATAPWPERPDPAAHVALVPGSTPVSEEVAAFVAAGGQALMVGATPAALTGPLAGLHVTDTTAQGQVATVADDPLLAGVGPQHLHWREPLTYGKLTGPGILLDGLVGVVPHGQGRFVLLQLTDAATADMTAAIAADPDQENPLGQAWHLKNRARTLWQANRLRALLLANLGLESSPAMIDGFFAPRRALPFAAIDKWVYAGGIPAPEDPKADPVDLDLAPVFAAADTSTPLTLAAGTTVPWHVPTDVNNGLGVSGAMDLSRVYGITVRRRTVAVTHIWSSRPRNATLNFGADWWFRVMLNGAEVFRTGTVAGGNGRSFGHGFSFTVRAPLRKGWNEVVCVIGSGSSGNGFWFQVSNPGDVISEPTLAPPAEEPWLFLRFAAGRAAKLSDAELAAAEDAKPGFLLYTAPLGVHDDPYLFMRW